MREIRRVPIHVKCCFSRFFIVILASKLYEFLLYFDVSSTLEGFSATNLKLTYELKKKVYLSTIKFPWQRELDSDIIKMQGYPDSLKPI
jgi:hypothetical protein